jgi:HEAT repeat protein
MRSICAWLAAICILLGTSQARAHGGTFKGGAGGGGGKGFQVPPDVADRREGPTTWETWWSANQVRLIHLADRVRGLDDSVVTGDVRLPDRERRIQRETFVRDKLVPLLLEALADKNAEIRSSAAIALGKCGDPRARKPLQKTAATDSDDDVRASAVIALGVLGDELALPFLDGVLGDVRDNPRRRAFAAIAIGLLGGDDAASALVRFCTERAHLWHVGAKEKERLIASAFVGLGLSDSAAALGLLRDTATNVKESVPLRGAAVLSLGRLRDRDATGAIARLLHERETRAVLRRSAAIALGGLVRVEDEKTLGVLMKAASDDPDLIVREQATLALARVRTDVVRKHLRKWFGKAPDLERPNIALALALGGDVDAAKLIRDMLGEDRDEGRRASYCLALGLLGDLDSAALVESELDGFVLSRHKRYAVLALALMDSQGSRDKLHGMLTASDNPTVKVNLVVALALLGDRRSRDYLLATLDGRHPVRDRAGAAVTLGLLRMVEGAPALVKIVGDAAGEPTVRAFALVGLGFMADESDFPKLARLAEYGGHTLPVEPLQELLTIL